MPCNCVIQLLGLIFATGVLQSVIEGETNMQLTLFSDEAWFHSQGYINMKNNRYWSSQNPHLTHDVLLHLVKVGVWCAVNASNCFVMTVNCEGYLCV
jgi:hypothetical protein